MVQAGTAKHPRTGSLGLSCSDISRPATSGAYDSLRSDEIIIGLALGSPRKTPPPTVLPDDRDSLANYSSPRSAEGAIMREKGDERIDGKGPKARGAKWKGFGGLFSKRDNQARTSPHLPFSPDQDALQAEPSEHFPQCAKTTRSNAILDQEKRVQQSSISSHSQERESASVLRRSSTKRKILRKRKIEELKNERQRAHTFPPSGVFEARPHLPRIDHLQKGHCELPVPRPSLLQVDIPNIEMERYSVMFGDVLSLTPQKTAQISLLARRQANLDDLVPKPLSIRKGSGSSQQTPRPAEEPKAQDIPKPARRDHSASSSVSKSPSFSLFPTITPATSRGAPPKPVPKPSPLSRSITSPHSTESLPVRPTLKTSKSEDMNEFLILAENRQDFLPSKTPTTEARKPSITEFCSELPPKPSLVALPGVAAERDHSVVSMGKDAPQRPFPARKSSMKNSPAVTSPKPQPQSLRQSNDSIHSLSAAEVSIARQISFSHRQRQLLVPIMSKNVKQPQLIASPDFLAMRNSHHLQLEQV